MTTLTMGSLGKVSKDALWIVGSQALVMVASLTALRQITGLLPESEYGQAYLFINGVVLALHLFVAPLSQAANRYYHDSLANLTIDSILGFVWRVQVFVILLVCGGYTLLIFALNATDDPYAIAYLVLPLYFALTAFQQIVIGLLNIGRRHALHAMLQVVDAWMRPGLAMILAWLWHADANAVIVGYLLAAIVTGPVSLIILNRMGSLPPYRLPLPNRDSMVRILSYAAPFMGFALSGWILSLSDRYIINILLGPEETGLYVAGYQVGSQLFLVASGLFCALVQPMLFQSASRNHSEAQEALSRWARLFVWYTTPILIGFFLIKEWLLRWLVAPAYWDAAAIVGFVGVGNYFLAVANYASTAFFIAERPDKLLLGYCLSAVMNVVLNFVLIPSLGIRGAAISTCISYAFYAVVCIVVGRRQLRWRIPWHTLLMVWSGVGSAGLLALNAKAAVSFQPDELMSFFVTLGTFALGIMLFIWLTRTLLANDLAFIRKHLLSPVTPKQTATSP